MAVLPSTVKGVDDGGFGGTAVAMARQEKGVVKNEAGLAPVFSSWRNRQMLLRLETGE